MQFQLLENLNLANEFQVEREKPYDYTNCYRARVNLSCTEKLMGALQDPVTWYGINFAGTQITQWDFQNKGTLTSPARLSFVLKVPLRYLRPSIIYSVPCEQILQRAYCLTINWPALSQSQ